MMELDLNKNLLEPKKVFQSCLVFSDNQIISYRPILRLSISLAHCSSLSSRSLLLSVSGVMLTFDGTTAIEPALVCKATDNGSGQGQGYPESNESSLLNSSLVNSRPVTSYSRRRSRGSCIGSNCSSSNVIMRTSLSSSDSSPLRFLTFLFVGRISWSEMTNLSEWSTAQRWRLKKFILCKRRDTRFNLTIFTISSSSQSRLQASSNFLYLSMLLLQHGYLRQHLMKQQHTLRRMSQTR